MKFNPKRGVIKSEPFNLSIQLLTSVVRKIFSSVVHTPHLISQSVIKV